MRGILKEGGNGNTMGMREEAIWGAQKVGKEKVGGRRRPWRGEDTALWGGNGVRKGNLRGWRWEGGGVVVNCG